MENENFEENNFDSDLSNFDGSVLDDSFTEVEKETSVDSDLLVRALLQLMEEQEAAEVEEDNSDPVELEQLEGSELDSETDYTDLLLDINDSVSYLNTVVQEGNETSPLNTPLSDYTLEQFLLLGILVTCLIRLGYQFLKDFMLSL